MVSKMKDSRSRLIERLKVDWQNRQLLSIALTHSSFTYENRHFGAENNQRLEFLGDAVLELAVSDYLYKNNPGHSEGDLTKLRASVVCEPSLARVAGNLDLGQCLSMGKGEERSGGRMRPSILADAFEALLGAIYLDQGLERAAEVAIGCMEPLLQDVMEGRLERDYKTELQELVQQSGGESVSYVIIREDGPDHHKMFTAGVLYKGSMSGTGVGRSKKDAEQQAAKTAIAKIGQMICSDPE